MTDYMTSLKLSSAAYDALDKLCDAAYPAAVTEPGAELATNTPGFLAFRRRLLAMHARRHLVTELVATGKLTQSEAENMVDAGDISSARPAAAGAAFANILAWLQANGPTIEQDIAAAIPIIISLISLFGG